MKPARAKKPRQTYLKPCPFCGSDNVTMETFVIGSPHAFYAYCNSCYASGPAKHGSNLARARWNAAERGEYLVKEPA